MIEQMNDWTNERNNKRTNERTNERTNDLSNIPEWTIDSIQLIILCSLSENTADREIARAICCV